MRRRDKQSKGFSLIEAAVAIGVIAILAAAAAPLVLKALNQQREARARSEMKLAFETLFGSRERVIPNMRSDFGFAPPGGRWDLGKMMSPSAPPTPNPPQYGLNSGSVFQWGWNGPYWSGQTKLVGGFQVPVDPWGNPYLIRTITGASPGYQILCTGRNGIENTALTTAIPRVDDYVYPSTPVPTTSGTGSVGITIKNATATDQQVRVVVQWKSGTTLASSTLDLDVKVDKLVPFNFSTVPVGTIQISISYPAGAAVLTFSNTYVYELVQGQSLSIPFTI